MQNRNKMTWSHQATYHCSIKTEFLHSISIFGGISVPHPGKNKKLEKYSWISQSPFPNPAIPKNRMNSFKITATHGHANLSILSFDLLKPPFISICKILSKWRRLYPSEDPYQLPTDGVHNHPALHPLTNCLACYLLSDMATWQRAALARQNSQGHYHLGLISSSMQDS